MTALATTTRAPRDRTTVAAALFAHLRALGIKHCRLGPDDGGDLDIVVDPARLAAMAAVLHDFCDAGDLRLVQALRHEWSAWYFALTWTDGDGAPRFLHPDICGDYRRDGRVLMTAADLLAERRDGEPPTPAPARAFVYYLLKKIEKGALDPGHGDYLSALWAEDPVGAARRLARYVGARDADGIARAASGNAWGPVRERLADLRAALHRRLPIGPMDRLREAWRWIERARRPTGLVIAAMGPDGSGKSSLIERLRPAVAPAFRATANHHFRPGLGSRRRAAAPVTDPHGQDPRGRLASAAKLVFFLVDYTLGGLVRVWPARVRSTLVIFDRHYPDLLIDPRRYRFAGPAALARLVGRLIPAPDLWLVLDVPASLAVARKGEVPLAEAERQRRAYGDFAAATPHAVRLDASRSIEQVVAAAADALLDHLARRMEARHGRRRR